MTSRRIFFAAFAAAAFGCSSSSPASNGADGGARDATSDTSSTVDGSPVTDRDAAKDDAAASCTQADGVSFGTDVCNRCMDAHCCASVDACFQDTDCSDLSDCISACASDAGASDGGPGCRGGCRTTHAASTAKYDAVVTCQGASCAQACP